MKTRTFKAGDYCRFTTEEIPTIIALLKANGWGASDNIRIGECAIFCYEDSRLSSIRNPGTGSATNELSRHDFIVTALRLNEGDGLRSDMSTPEQRRHIAEVLIGLGCQSSDEDFLTEIQAHGFGYEERIAFWWGLDTKINHIPYSDWCKRLNETPIHIPDVGEKVEEKIDFVIKYFGLNPNICDEESTFKTDVGSVCEMISEYGTRNQKYAEPQITPSNTITLPDGTTVDLSKPFETVNGRSIGHVIGLNSFGKVVFEDVDDLGQVIYVVVDKIRNKPEEVKPELKVGDKVWFKHNGIVNSPDYFGTIQEIKDGSIVVNHQDYEPVSNVTIRPAFIDGVAQFPPFND